MSNVKVVLVPLTLRLAGTDEAQVLARASWAVRRLLGQGPAAEVDLRGFLGRAEVTAAQDPEADRPVGVELDALGEILRAHHDRLGAAHAMTRAAWDLALWHRDGITPWDEVLTRFPIVPAKLVTREAPCSPMSARRNLNLFTERGLAREITEQGRYRFWTAAL